MLLLLFYVCVCVVVYALVEARDWHMKSTSTVLHILFWDMFMLNLEPAKFRHTSWSASSNDPPLSASSTMGLVCITRLAFLRECSGWKHKSSHMCPSEPFPNPLPFLSFFSSFQTGSHYTAQTPSKLVVILLWLCKRWGHRCMPSAPACIASVTLNPWSVSFPSL